MEEQGIIVDEHISPNLLTLKTRLSGLSACLSCDSRLGICSFLDCSGWTRTSSAREASLPDKFFYESGGLEYLMLLKYHIRELTEYEEQFPFRHSQAKAYYDSFLAFFQHQSCVPRREGK